MPSQRNITSRSEDLTGAEGKGHWRRLLALVGARDLAASLKRRWCGSQQRRARPANEEAVAAAPRAGY